MSAGSTPSQTISILIVDDHVILTDALAMVLRSQPDLHVAGVAGTCAAARDLLARGCPDVLLLDVGLPDGDGLGLAPEFKQSCPNTSILVLTSLADDATLMRATQIGVNGFISKDQSLSELIVAIHQAAEGEIVMPPSLLLGVLGRIQPGRASRPTPPGREPLTPREREILTCLAKGMSVPQLAAALSIAPMTVRTHIRNLMEKLGVHSRLEAVVYALSRGLIEPPV